jgi:hypothetical protein
MCTASYRVQRTVGLYLLSLRWYVETSHGFSAGLLSLLCAWLATYEGCHHPMNPSDIVMQANVRCDKHNDKVRLEILGTAGQSSCLEGSFLPQRPTPAQVAVCAAADHAQRRSLNDADRHGSLPTSRIERKMQHACLPACLTPTPTPSLFPTPCQYPPPYHSLSSYQRLTSEMSRPMNSSGLPCLSWRCAARWAAVSCRGTAAPGSVHVHMLAACLPCAGLCRACLCHRM